MAKQTKQWAAIIMMIALFAMIAFVTNLCSPMATIVKNQFGASELAGQIGNYANFIAYLVMGIPSGMLIAKFGYKKTALLALIVGLVGIGFEYLSGVAGSYWIYLIGAFISGLCMCMLNTVVNPLLASSCATWSWSSTSTLRPMRAASLSMVESKRMLSTL